LAPVVQTATSGRPQQAQQQGWPTAPDQNAAPQQGMLLVPLTYAEVDSSTAPQQQQGQPEPSAARPPPPQQQQQQQPMRRKLSDIAPLSGVQPAGPSAISAGKHAEANARAQTVAILYLLPEDMA
jgi:hypothetical protein